MLISGLQKVTLLDFPGRVACTVFTGGCNFRCPFCQNASLVLPEKLAAYPGGEDAVLRFLEQRRGLLDGVAITGGEPLLHAELPAFLGRVRAMGYQIKVDTNGAFPERLKALVGDGLVDMVAMDVKNAPELYAKTAGLRELDFSAIERSRDYLLSGVVPYEFRTTVVRGLHTEERLLETARWISGAEAYFLQGFRSEGDLLSGAGLGAFTPEEMRAFAEAVRPIVPAVQLRGVD